jgi:uncharacterized protein YyaL (SSP411 family)
MLGDEAMIKRARQTLRGFSESWSRSPQGLPLMLAGLLDWQSPPRQIVLAGKPGSKDFEALAREVRKRFLPGLVVLAADGGEGQQWLGERVSYLRDTVPVEGAAAAYVCENFTCQLPFAAPDSLSKRLAEKPAKYGCFIAYLRDFAPNRRSSLIAINCVRMTEAVKR